MSISYFQILKLYFFCIHIYLVLYALINILQFFITKDDKHQNDIWYDVDNRPVKVVVHF